MPTKRRSITRPSIGTVPEGVIHLLRMGELPPSRSDTGRRVPGWFAAFERLRDNEALRLDWRPVHGELLPDWIRGFPGTRPHGWWILDPPASDPRFRGGRADRAWAAHAWSVASRHLRIHHHNDAFVASADERPRSARLREAAHEVDLERFVVAGINLDHWSRRTRNVLFVRYGDVFRWCVGICFSNRPDVPAPFAAVIPHVRFPTGIGEQARGRRLALRAGSYRHRMPSKGRRYFTVRLEQRFLSVASLAISCAAKTNRRRTQPAPTARVRRAPQMRPQCGSGGSRD